MFVAFGIGLLASFFGFSAPGMLNVTATKIALEQSKRRAFKFNLGVGLVTILQAFIAIYLVQISAEATDVLLSIQKFSVVIFIALSIYFFRKAYQEQKDITAKKQTIKPLHYGLVLAVANMFAIPFFYGVFLLNTELLSLSETTETVPIVLLGIFVGIQLIFGLYVTVVSRLKSGFAVISKYLNLVLGSLTAIVALLALVKLV